MFDVGLQELALIFGVSLVVLGPKRMSGLVTKVGRWVGKARTMARDFRQQLENEVNLDELNRMTDLQTQQSQSLPTPPPGLNGEPAPESISTYPYSAPDAPEPSESPPPVESSAGSDETPSAGLTPADDTYSHAHAEGAAPIPWEPETAAEAATRSAADQARVDTAPVQADLDLAPAPAPSGHPLPDDLPPDDARRYL